MLGSSEVREWSLLILEPLDFDAYAVADARPETPAEAGGPAPYAADAWPACMDWRGGMSALRLRVAVRLLPWPPLRLVRTRLTR
jgi:hypothetical protein